MFQFPDSVRVIRLMTPSRPYIGTPGKARPPAIGDVGTVVAVSAEHHRFQVEMVDDSGATVCLADFVAQELELSPGPKYGHEQTRG